MFGFYSFSENPFSSASVVSAGEVKTGVAVLNASGNLTADLSSAGSIREGNSLLSSSGIFDSNGRIIHGGFATLEASGSLTSNGSVLVPIDSSLETSGNLTSNLSRIAVTLEGAASLSSSGVFDSNISIVHGGSTSANASGELTSDIHVVHGGISQFEASGTLGVSESVELDGASLLLDAGTVSAKGTLLSVSSSSTEASGTITPDPGRIIPHGSSLSGSGIVTGISSSRKVSATDISSSGTTTNNGTLILGPLYSIESSGTIDPNGSNLIAGKASLTSPGATIVAGKFAPGELTASLSASSSITAQIGLDLESQATIGQSAKEFVRKTSRPNYKPALPELSNKDEGIILDFPFYEGAGNLRSVSSRRQSGNANMLMWGRVDGRQSLTSNGGSYNNYRITFDSTDFNFSDGSLLISFKPTRSTSGSQFLFNNRGTGNNNNEIDIYSLNSSNKVRIDIYNGTSRQRLDVPNLSFNSWNTLIVTFGSDLNASLNGNDFSTYSSITMPSANSSTSYILGNPDDRFGMEGSVDHFRLYDRQISQTYAKQLHRNIYQDYSLDYIIPNHYEMSRVTSSGRLMKNSGSNISASGQVISRGSFLIAQIKAALGGEGLITANGILTDFDVTTASLQAAATIAANGILLGELDTVPFTMLINRLEEYNIDVYRQFAKEFNVAKSKAISASIDKINITDINIDKILEANLEK
jgi:hypothetical protein